MHAAELDCINALALTGVAKKLYVKGISSFKVSPGTGDVISVYVPEIKSAPASVAIYKSATLPKGGTESPQALARRNFFRVRCTDLHGSV